MRAWRLICRELGVITAVLLCACAGSEPGDAERCDGGACAGTGALAPGGCDGGCWQPAADDEAFANELCSSLAGCCARMHDPRDVPVPSEADHVAWCAEVLLRDSFSRDAGVRAACLVETKQAAGTNACVPEFWPPNPSSACSRLVAELAGPTPVGQRCYARGDCASKVGSVTWCGSPTGNRAYCELWEPGEAGDPCVVSFAGSFLAVPVPTTELVGRSCSNAAGLACLPVHASSTGHFCGPLLPDGADCLWPITCASHVCTAVPGSNWGRCGPAFEPHDLPDGASCTDDENCHSGHCVLSACVPASQYAGAIQFCAQ